MCLAYLSGSRRIQCASRLIVISWLFSLQFWILLEGDALTFAYLLVDIALACAFYLLSRGSWFPAPLFFLHAVIVVFHFYILAIDQSPFWMLVFLNRTFDMALIYIAACALFRIRALAR